MSGQQPAPANSWKWCGLGALAILALALLAYAPVRNGEFVWDDVVMVTQNPLNRAPDGLYSIWFTTKAVDYVPMTLTTFWLEWRLWEDRAGGYHITNVLIHALGCILLWRALRTFRLPGAWLTAAVFAVHPVGVASVAWITERKNTLSLVFFALTLLAYWKSEQGPPEAAGKPETRGPKSERNPKPEARKDASVTAASGGDRISVLGLLSDFGFRASDLPARPMRWGWYLLAVAAFFFGLASKASVVVLPVLLLLGAWWQRGRLEPRDWGRTAPFFGLSIAFGLLAIHSQHKAIGGEVFLADDLIVRLIGGTWALWFYLYKILLPVNLCAIYPRWEIDARLPWVYLPFLLWTAGLWACWRYRRGWGRPLLFALLFFWITLGPVLGVFNMSNFANSRVADHWVYLPMIGVLALVLGALSAAEWRPAFLRRTPVRVGGSVLLLGTLAALTWHESSVFAFEESLWRENVRRNPKSWGALNNLGNTLSHQGRHAEAIPVYERALALRPNYAEGHNNYGLSLANVGRVSEALEHYRIALRHRPDYAEAYNNTGLAYVNRGDHQGAIVQFREALRRSPNFAIAHNNLGHSLAATGQVDEAIGHYRQSIAINPRHPFAYGNLGQALVTQRKHTEAVEVLEKALRLDPNYASAHIALGSALSELGRNEESLQHYQTAYRLKPDSTVCNDLGIAHAMKGNMAEAIRFFREAIRLKPENVGALSNLGNALASQGLFDEAIVQYTAALRFKPEDDQTHYNLGVAHFQQGRAPEAARHFEAALKTNPANAQAHYNLGLMRARLGQADAALARFREALRLKPDFAEAREQIGKLSVTPP